MKYFCFSFLMAIILASCTKDPPIDRSGTYSGKMHTVVSWQDNGWHSADTIYDSQIIVQNLNGDSLEFKYTIGAWPDGSYLHVGPVQGSVKFKINDTEIYTYNYSHGVADFNFRNNTLIYHQSGASLGGGISSNDFTGIM